MLTFRTFRTIAVVEALSYLALLASSVAKRAFDVAGLVPVVGPIHGLIFLVYAVGAVSIREELEWSGWLTVGVVAAAVVPFGGLVVERRVLPRPDAVSSRLTRRTGADADGADPLG